MNTNDKFEHPEILEFMHICSVSPDMDGAREVCELMRNTTIIAESERTKIENELDKSLEDTFPASDPVTHY